MSRKVMVVLAALLLLPLLAAAENWNNVALVDDHCVNNVKANPDAHTRECMLKCQKAGYGILTPDGKYLKLDAKGNEQAYELLKKSTAKDHIRVNVVGEVSGDTIKVQSIKM